MAEHVDEPSELKCAVGTDDIDAIKDTVDEWVTQFYKHQLQQVKDWAMKFLQQELDKWKARCSQLQSDKDKLAEEAKSLHTRLQDMEDVTQGSSLQPHGFGTLQDNQDMTNKLDDDHSEDEMREAPNDDYGDWTSDLNVAIEQAVSETVIEYQAIIQQMKIDHQQELYDKDDHYGRVIDDNQ